MKKLLAKLGISAALMAAVALPLASGAEAAMAYGADGVGVLQNQIAPVEKTQFFFGGYNYCWYPSAWNGPGWYYCGYAWNRGYGWGGGYGWHGWRGGRGFGGRGFGGRGFGGRGFGARGGFHGGFHGGGGHRH